MTNTSADCGVGYICLRFAVGLAKKFRTIRRDLTGQKIDACCRHVDPAGEVALEDLRTATHFTVTINPTQHVAAAGDQPGQTPSRLVATPLTRGSA